MSSEPIDRLALIGARVSLGAALIGLRWSLPEDRPAAVADVRASVGEFKRVTGRAPTAIEFLQLELAALALLHSGAERALPPFTEDDALNCTFRTQGPGALPSPSTMAELLKGLPLHGTDDPAVLSRRLRKAAVALWQVANSTLPLADVLAARIALQLLGCLAAGRTLPADGALLALAPHGPAFGFPPDWSPNP